MPPIRLEGDDDDDETGEHVAEGTGDTDADFDDDRKDRAKAYRDGDDRRFLSFGRVAAASEARTLAGLVERYYADVSTEDGAGACALLDRKLVRATTSSFNLSPGPAYLRGVRSCAAAMALIFKHSPNEGEGMVRVTGTRVHGHQARVFVGWVGAPAGYMELNLEGGTWKIGQILAAPLP